MSSVIKATFELVTPMFLGGGDADQKAEFIRPPSVKGALRFWWRALNWGRISQGKSQPEALKQLHDEEARLFGLAATEADGRQRGGQGVFLLTVSQEDTVKIEKQPFDRMTDGQFYLLGMGIGKYTHDSGKHCLRSALVNGQFGVQLRFRPGTKTEDKKSVADAMYLFGLLGALGSRARHGMGSVSLSAWEGDDRGVPADFTGYKSALKSIIKLQGDTPPYTAFSKDTRIDISLCGKDPFQLLTDVGAEQQLYRSYGQSGKVNGKPAERNFAEDHDLILQATQGNRVQEAPQRAVFGLPHNYFFSSTKGKADVNYAPDRHDGRRASPLFLHIHQLPDGCVCAVHTLLPAQFLPEGASIQIKIKSGRTHSDVPAEVNWQVLHDYLNRKRFEKRETLFGAQ
ncbi:type III-B CRISPR module RAMP protein Cmr1 [Chitinilyticum piscinae]|uniref:Type III-B CRISPR module RAMP protein Cmr1 n=1 Tax=Chitinilyticum piscinae TaxID=2866724 RepID=A0A8J7K981_9NEIS|nr:type III-B CRISPR module RAMP protein Cmr1 [Chitinilyticum piscinae]MBE9610828.1 type III-B CRISPR module RAMP protein Cmr1 [Chitinilyticum piscinae]